MTSLSNILAEGDSEGLLRLILLLGAAGVIAVVRWLGKKASEKQAEQQAADQARRLRESLEADRAGLAPRAPAQNSQAGQGAPQPPYHPIDAPPVMTQQAPQRRRRKPPAQPMEPVVLDPIEHRLVNAQADMPSTSRHDFYDNNDKSGAPGPRAWAVQTVAADLSNPDMLRQAVIYHELLSPPKALRDESEPWEV